MKRHVVSEWQRRLRETANHLTSSARDIFGAVTPVAFTPSDPTPDGKTDPAGKPAPNAHRAAGKNDRLPPRERRGRD